jgi:hypothetical protein
MKLMTMAAAVRAALGAHAARAGLVLGVLALVIEKADYEKLGKEVQKLYEEKDGKYHLDVDGVEDVSGLKSALVKERDAAKAAVAALKELKAQWEGLDPVEIRKLMEKLGGDEEATLLKAGKLDEVVAKKTEKQRQAHEKAIQTAEAKVKAAEVRAAKFSQRVLDNHIRAAAGKAGVHANAVDDALFRARTIFVLSEDGEAVQLDKDGHTVFGKDGKTPFSPGEWLEGMKESAPHWYPAGAGGGGAVGDRGGKGGQRTMKRAEFDGLDPVAKAQTIKDKVQVVD